MANVPVVRTSFAMKDFARACIMAWKRLTNAFPKKEAVGIIYAQYALETGGGGYCWCNNIGNLKCTQEQAAAGVPYMMLAGTWEIIGGQKVVFQPPHPATWFRAFSSLDEGMAAHLDLLKNKRYASAWPAVESGEPRAFAIALKARGYFTAPVDDYAKLMQSGWQKWMREPAFDDAMAEVLRTLEADTSPEIENPPSSQPTVQIEVPSARPTPMGSVIVHPSVEFFQRRYDNGPGSPDDPDDAA